LESEGKVSSQNIKMGYWGIYAGYIENIYFVSYIRYLSIFWQVMTPEEEEEEEEEEEIEIGRKKERQGQRQR